MPSKALTVAPPQAITSDADVNALFSEWQNVLRKRVGSGEISSTTLTTYVIGMRKFLAWHDAERFGDQVNDDLIRDWKIALRDAGRKPGAINTWLSGVRAFFSWAVGAHHLFYNPSIGVAGAKRSRTSKHKREALTDDEMVRIFEVLRQNSDTPIGKRDRAIIMLMAYTGARTVEVYRADFKGLRTESGNLVLDVQGKGHGEADQILVIWDTEASSAMRDWVASRGNFPGPLFVALSHNAKNTRLSLRYIRHLVKRKYRLAGVVGNKTTHSLRHTAITSAIKHGAPVEKTQAMARHANVSTTFIYVHETDRVQNPAEAFIHYGSKEDEQ